MSADVDEVVSQNRRTRLPATNLPSPDARLLGPLIMVVADGPDTVFAAFLDSNDESGNVFCRSTDGGRTWLGCTEEVAVPVSYRLGVVFGQGVAVDPRDPSKIYLCIQIVHSGQILPVGLNTWLRSIDAAAT